MMTWHTDDARQQLRDGVCAHTVVQLGEAREHALQRRVVRQRVGACHVSTRRLARFGEFQVLALRTHFVVGGWLLW
jgi:hypothetical protein